MFDETLAALVRSVMARRTPAVNVSELARRTGIPRATLSKLTNGKTSMAIWQLRKIAEALSIDAGRLLDRATRIANGVEVDPLDAPPADEHKAG